MNWTWSTENVDFRNTPGPGSGGTTPRSDQPDNEIIFLREDDANEISPTIRFMLPKGDTNEA